MERFVKRLFAPKQKKVFYNSKPLLIFTVKDIPEELEDRDKDTEQHDDRDETRCLIAIEEDSAHLVRVAMQLNIPPSSNGIVVVTTDEKGLVQIGILLERYITKQLTKASGVINEFRNRPFIVMVPNPTNVPLSQTTQQGNSTAFPLPPAIVHNKTDKLSPCISDPPLSETISRFHHRPYVHRPQQREHYKQVTEKDKMRLTEDR